LGTDAISTIEADRRHMAAALSLSSRNLGRTWPNPSVGCILVNDGRIVGRGVTAPGGRPHAETIALKLAGDRARGATAYVTLEPCAHHGQTSPCCDALIAAGVARVVVPMPDPDPRTGGSGLTRLAEAGVTVDAGLFAEEAQELQAGFVSRVVRGRPLVTLKVAASLDARSALATGESQWITGQAARDAGHALRARNDAIMVGRGTVVLDNPSLTCRLPGLEGASPVRVVCDSDLALLEFANCALFDSGETPLWVVCSEEVSEERRSEFLARGQEVLPVERNSAGLDPLQVLEALGARGITRLLIEGGATLATSFLRADLVDRMVWFGAPMLLGGESRPSVGDLGIGALSDAAAWRILSTARAGEDTITTLARKRN